MKCPKCGGETPTGGKFCVFCGEPMPAPKVVPVPPPAPAPAPDPVPPTGGMPLPPRSHMGDDKKFPVLPVVLGLAALLIAGGVLLPLLLRGKDKDEFPREEPLNWVEQQNEEPEESLLPEPEAAEELPVEEPLEEIPAVEVLPSEPTVEEDVSWEFGGNTDDEYILPHSDSAYLTDADLAGLSKTELQLARNEILARHGRIFRTQWIREYFESKSWYEGTIDPDYWDAHMGGIYNQYESYNISLIKQYEAR